jgi:hypothetical protein
MASHLFDNVIYHSWQAVRIVLKELSCSEAEDFTRYSLSHLRAEAIAVQFSAYERDDCCCNRTATALLALLGHSVAFPLLVARRQRKLLSTVVAAAAATAHLSHCYELCVQLTVRAASE